MKQIVFGTVERTKARTSNWTGGFATVLADLPDGKRQQLSASFEVGPYYVNAFDTGPAFSNFNLGYLQVSEGDQVVLEVEEVEHFGLVVTAWASAFDWRRIERWAQKLAQDATRGIGSSTPEPEAASEPAMEEAVATPYGNVQVANDTPSCSEPVASIAEIEEMPPVKKNWRTKVGNSRLRPCRQMEKEFDKIFAQ